MPVEPMIVQIKYEMKIGDTDNETKNNTIEVKQDIPTANPSIPSIILNMFIMIIIHIWVMMNDIIGLKKIGCI